MPIYLDEVLAVDALLAWLMNGTELVPGRYGEENPKWLTQVKYLAPAEALTQMRRAYV